MQGLTAFRGCTSLRRRNAERNEDDVDGELLCVFNFISVVSNRDGSPGGIA